MDDIFVHSSSCVHENAQIGKFTNIWRYCHLEAGAIVGENCNIGQSCYVGNDARVGNGCRLGNNVSIFSNVYLEDFVFCGPSMVFTHIRYPRAIVKRHHVFEKTIVKRGATLGANCTITPGIIIGEGSFIAAGAIVSNNVKPWALVVGAPAKHVGWISAYGEKIDLPLEGEGTWNCEHSGDQYILQGNYLDRSIGEVDVLKYEKGNRFTRKVIDR